jgi:tripartite-type tricarboxylate transporter receptor subunit TctC
MPEDIRAKLGQAIVEVVKQPEIQKKFREIGFEPMLDQGVKEFTAYHEAEVKRWTAFLTEIGIRK